MKRTGIKIPVHGTSIGPAEIEVRNDAAPDFQLQLGVWPPIREIQQDISIELAAVVHSEISILCG